MKLIVTVIRDDDDEILQMFLLNKVFLPLSTPSIPLEEGYISSKITKYNFALAQVELIPNENFDGNFETIGDLLNKFDYMFHKEVLYEIENKNNNTTIMEKMRNKVFWPLVKKLAIKDKLIETFDESNLEDDSINQIMQWKMKERKKND